MLTIGQVAACTGIRASAIRYYEEMGLLPRADRRGGQRIYDRAILGRLALIGLAKHAGFTIREIRALLERGPRLRPAAACWSDHAREKMRELDEQIARTTRERELLQQLTLCECPTLDDCGRVFDALRVDSSNQRAK